MASVDAAGRPLQLLADLGEAEAAQVEALGRRRAHQLGQQPGHRARGLDVAERRQDEQLASRRPGRPGAAAPAATARRRGGCRRGRPPARTARPRPAVPRPRRRRPGTGPRATRRLRRAASWVDPERAQDLAPRPVRRGPLGLDATAPRHSGAGGERRSRELLGQPGLADPRLAGAQDQPSGPGAGRVEPASRSSSSRARPTSAPLAAPIVSRRAPRTAGRDAGSPR